MLIYSINDYHRMGDIYIILNMKPAYQVVMQDFSHGIQSIPKPVCTRTPTFAKHRYIWTGMVLARLRYDAIVHMDLVITVGMAPAYVA